MIYTAKFIRGNLGEENYCKGSTWNTEKKRPK